MFPNTIDLTNTTNFQPQFSSINLADSENSQQSQPTESQKHLGTTQGENLTFSTFIPAELANIQDNLMNANQNDNHATALDEKKVKNFWNTPLSNSISQEDSQSKTLFKSQLLYLKVNLKIDHDSAIMNKLRWIKDIRKIGIIVYLFNYDPDFRKSLINQSLHPKKLFRKNLYDNFIHQKFAAIDQFKKAHQKLPKKIYNTIPSGKSYFLFKFLAELCLTKEGTINHGGVVLAKEIAQKYFKDERRSHILSVLTQLQMDSEFQKQVCLNYAVHPELQLEICIGLNLSTKEPIGHHEIRLLALISTLFPAVQLESYKNCYPEVFINYLAYNDAKKLHQIYINFLTLNMIYIADSLFPGISTSHLFADILYDKTLLDIKIPLEELKNLFVIRQLCAALDFDLEKASRGLESELTIGEFLNVISEPSSQELMQRLFFDLSFLFKENRLQQILIKHFQSIAYQLCQLANTSWLNQYVSTHSINTFELQQLRFQMHMSASKPSAHILNLLQLFKLNPNVTISRLPHVFFIELFEMLKANFNLHQNDPIYKNNFTLFAVSGPTTQAPCEHCFTITPFQFQEIWTSFPLEAGIKRYLLDPAAETISLTMTAQKAEWILRKAFLKEEPEIYQQIQESLNGQSDWPMALEFYNTLRLFLFTTKPYLEPKFTQTFNDCLASVNKDSFINVVLEFFIKEAFPVYEEDILFIRKELSNTYSNENESFVSIYNLAYEIQRAMCKLKKNLPSVLEIEKKLQLYFKFPLTIELADLHYAKGNQESPSHLKLVAKMQFTTQKLDFYHRLQNDEIPISAEEQQMYSNISIFFP